MYLEFKCVLPFFSCLKIIILWSVSNRSCLKIFSHFWSVVYVLLMYCQITSAFLRKARILILVHHKILWILWLILSGWIYSIRIWHNNIAVLWCTNFSWIQVKCFTTFNFIMQCLKIWYENMTLLHVQCSITKYTCIQDTFAIRILHLNILCSVS